MLGLPRAVMTTGPPLDEVPRLRWIATELGLTRGPGKDLVFSHGVPALPRSHERELPNGLIVDVGYVQPVDADGWVVTCQDITARQRAEQGRHTNRGVRRKRDSVQWQRAKPERMSHEMKSLRIDAELGFFPRSEENSVSPTYGGEAMGLVGRRYTKAAKPCIRNKQELVISGNGGSKYKNLGRMGMASSSASSYLFNTLTATPDPEPTSGLN
jgi:hypothetical protein